MHQNPCPLDAQERREVAEISGAGDVTQVLERQWRIPTPLRRMLQGLSGLCTYVKSPFVTKPPAQPRRKIDVRTLNQCPEGYPRLAAFLDADENFMLYRRFGFLQARVLLYKQDELRELERELDRIDCIDQHSNDKSVLKSREKDDKVTNTRKNMIGKIETKLKEYSEMLLISRDLVALNRPPHRDYTSVKSYFDEEAPLCDVESYIYSREDIVALKPGRESAWLDSFIEGLLQRFACRLIRCIFRTSDLQKKTNPEETNIILYSRDRIGIVVSLIILVTILALLITPVYLLWHFTSGPETASTTAVMITIFGCFTLLFSLTLSKFTSAKRQEILAAAAAYCAVLVVFVGNVKQNRTS
ncbi:uncharacterized protein LY89DRAFT_642559 [Mollisia scopiformis]|uniref:DUF6594 domain-containing protein n=1 Tax=Mollisia scopiformis TaxID=149040 RepID=A0A194XH47_MOLSC|nr:uncharacterized protein LY89DRAFT_642559 [Mollisia scopiformis]KUJ19488.1 hypothetical protein LY89DRAFT_642559 [Mollisia scopiformis]